MNTLEKMKAMRPVIDALKEEICELLCDDDLPTEACLAAMTELVAAGVALTTSDEAFERNVQEILRYFEDQTRHMRRSLKVELH